MDISAKTLCYVAALILCGLSSVVATDPLRGMGLAFFALGHMVP